MDKMRLWLMYPNALIMSPVVCNLCQNFVITTNIRQASVTNEIGILSLELTGAREEITRAIAWMEEIGIKVEPVEINTIE